MKKHDEYFSILLDALKENSRISLSDGVGLLGVSESTMRRLFSRLENDGKAFRVHGGLQLIPESPADYSFDRKECERITEKRKVAEKTFPLIIGSSSVYLDSGSTLSQVSSVIAAAARKNPIKDTCFFTNSLKNLEQLTGLVQIQLIGGEYRAYRRDFCGFLAETALMQLNFDVCVLGTDGYSPLAGFTATDFHTARLNSLVIERSSAKIVVGDSLKFDHAALVTYATTADIDFVISNENVDADTIAQLEAKGIKLILA